MGTGTSTLSAIESLSSSLQEIERKLAVLEDSHLHHEKTICFDDSVIVSGKRIQVYLLAHCILFYSYFLPILYVYFCSMLIHIHLTYSIHTVSCRSQTGGGSSAWNSYY